MAKNLKKWKPQVWETKQINFESTENNFKVGEAVPLEFFIMWNAFDKFTELPVFMDGDDWNTYGERCNDIPDQQTAERLHQQWKDFLKMKKENE